MFRDVRYRVMAGRLAEASEMKFVPLRAMALPAAALFILAAVLPIATRSGSIALPPEAREAMDAMYGGDPDAAIPVARRVQKEMPDHPLGYLLEAEALWWKRYCASCEIRYGMMDAWKRGRNPGDDAYLAVCAREIEAAERLLARSETAEMHVYAGLGYALRARVYGLRGENRNVARAAVKGRAEMLRALELDPQQADAAAVLGVYNYYVETLSPIVKILRVFMGIPGGNKDEGIRQMELGARQGVFMAVDSRFILASLIRQYDLKYERALAAAEPLTVRYPRNPLFLLLVGNLNEELGRKSKAAEYFHAALEATVSDPVCAARVREMGGAFLRSVQ
jgi:tetratricopeptide (TPR) repeat protein